ncbi:MAG TPA: energy-coupled thiamine transporter ThiT [Terriglobales bacterium]|nr:energy-coupled thiamine transporter ThiT [Terriglobales bacterium]
MKINTRILTEIIAMVALAGVLEFVSGFLPFQMPEGGRVTLAAMVPIFFVAIRRGPTVGIIAGVAFGLVVLVEEPFVYNPIQFLLDYPLAFGALGLAGFFRKEPWLPLVGVAVGIGGRFICHFISGLVFFASYAPAGMDPAVYSALYNAWYLIPELIISEIVMFVLIQRKITQLYL